MLAFDNDEANDWAYGLEEVNDLSLVPETLEKVQATRGAYLEQDLAAEGLAACEVAARLQGRPGYTNAYTEKVDRWVAANPIRPPAEVISLAKSAVDRILCPDSELRELWENAGDEGWRDAVGDLRNRVAADAGGIVI